MRNDLTILYTTDNSLNESIYNKCKELLLIAADGIPIISVSQKPIDLGKNICVGNIGRSEFSLNKQLLTGLIFVETKYIAFAEHDCIYSREHFHWTPPNTRFFWYNLNCWMLQYSNPKYPRWDGQFSFRKKRALSQLICSTEMYRKAMFDRTEIISDPAWKSFKQYRMIGEPGSCRLEKTKLLAQDKKLQHLQEKIIKYITIYKPRKWTTKIPNIDIRHESNFTGAKRGSDRTFVLKPWGTIKDILG